MPTPTPAPIINPTWELLSAKAEDTFVAACRDYGVTGSDRNLLAGIVVRHLLEGIPVLVKNATKMQLVAGLTDEQREIAKRWPVIPRMR